jgi:poly(ADP-ribose) glycohydrolase ARH3
MRIEQVQGCLLAQAVADSIGATFEGQDTNWLRGRFTDKTEMFRYSADAPRSYTDDTEMALAIAKHLVQHNRIVPSELMQTFVSNYSPWRGYGRGTRVLMDAFRTDCDYEHFVQHLFPGGSFGNGAAMRAAPVGLRFWRDHDLVWEQAKQSALPTHRHELGIEAAQLIALTTAVAVTETMITPESIADVLIPRATTTVFTKQLHALRRITAESDLAQFGNGIAAHESVVTAIGCFSLYPDDFQEAISAAIWQGGDTDTIAAMTGALVGARLGVDAIDDAWVTKLEDAEFPGMVAELSRDLFHASLDGGDYPVR